MAKAKETAEKKVWVRATKVCFIEGNRRRPGAEFALSDERFFNKKCMVKVKAPVGDDRVIDEPEGDDDADISESSTKAEIQAALEKVGIRYTNGASKAELLELWFNDPTDPEGDDPEGDDPEEGLA